MCITGFSHSHHSGLGHSSGCLHLPQRCSLVNHLQCLQAVSFRVHFAGPNQLLLHNHVLQGLLLLSPPWNTHQEQTPSANSFPCFTTMLNPHVYIGQPTVTLYSYSHGHAHLGPYMPRIAPSASPVDLDSCRVQRLVKAPSRQRVHPHTSTSERESTTFT